MRHFGIQGSVLAILVGLAGCGGEEAPEPLVRIATPPPSSSESLAQPDASEGLPADWFVASSDGRGMMLEKLDDEDAWIWVALESSISGLDVNEGIKVHRKNVTDSPAGKHIDSGSVETRKHGIAAWSLGFFEGDGEEMGKNELVLYIPFPHRNTVLALHYFYPPGGPEAEARLRDLVAVADGLTEER